MILLTRQIVIVSILAVTLGSFSTSSALAMGRSSSPTREADSQRSLEQRVSKIERNQNDMQSSLLEELRELRKEVDDLKALQALQRQSLDGGVADAE